jgi:hypothetical protein
MGIAVLKAVTLATAGEDWRAPFHTREDEYRLYQEADARRNGRVRVRLRAGSTPASSH